MMEQEKQPEAEQERQAKRKEQSENRRLKWEKRNVKVRVKGMGASERDKIWEKRNWKDQKAESRKRSGTIKK